MSEDLFFSRNVTLPPQGQRNIVLNLARHHYVWSLQLLSCHVELGGQCGWLCNNNQCSFQNKRSPQSRSKTGKWQILCFLRERTTSTHQLRLLAFSSLMVLCHLPYAAGGSSEPHTTGKPGSTGACPQVLRHSQCMSFHRCASFLHEPKTIRPRSPTARWKAEGDMF